MKLLARIQSYRNILKLRVFGVWEIHLWLPYRLHEVRVIQVQGIEELRVVQSLVKPPLSEIEVDLIVLKR